ncbi:MAG: aminodeoxychorismate synthase component I [Chloroflexota bacterium]
MGRHALVREFHTPLAAASAFRLFEGRPYSFFLDSGMDPQRLGRYSFLGSDPFLVLKSKGRRVSLSSQGEEREEYGDPFDRLRALLATYALDSSDSPVPFNGGIVGYFSYDLCHFMERLPSAAADDLRIPECYLCLYDAIAAFDHLEGRAYIVSTGFPELEEGCRLRRAAERVAEIQDLLERARPAAPTADLTALVGRDGLRLRSNFSHEEYLRVVQKAREYIIDGDIFQVNLSQRFETELAIMPYELYQRLRAANPAPFACYLSFNEVSLVGSSPERFLRLQGDLVETRPIKGTRPRGKAPSQDETLARALLSSPKDRAENIMIVDLERNDLGRVCRYGSVRVTELAVLEAFPKVFHLTSTVVGRMRHDKDRVDLLRATFPGGSITGAPKVRAMEIIDELEPTKRSVYTGSIGYLSFSGEMDLNIVIRSFIVKGGRAYFQVGGGIVYDSDPEDEYMETLHKARGLMDALRLAPRMAVEVV